MHRPQSPFATRRANGRRGGALLISLLVLFVLMTAGASTISLALSRQSTAKTAKEVDHAYVVAEAGVNLALFELQLGTDLAGDGLGDVSGVLGGATYTTTITPAYTGPGQYTLRAVGAVSRIGRGVEAVVEEQAGGIPGFFGISNTSISGGIVDAYDSSLGSYASQVGVEGYALASGQLGSNFDVDLSGSNEVYGDATPGPAGSVTGDTTSVTGSTAPATSNHNFDPYVYAPPIASAGSWTAASSILSTGVHRFDDITLSGSDVLTLDGDVELYVDGDISVFTEIVLTAGSTAVIHHGTGVFKVTGSGIVNTSKDPSRLSLFSATTDEVRIAGSGAFHGTLQALDGSLVVSNGDFHGAAVADTLTISNGAVHQDLALGPGGNGDFTVLMMRPFQP